MKPTARKPITASALLSALLALLMSLALAALVPARAQGLPSFEAQINAATAALSAGELDKALALGDAAIRISPERWDGYAVAGQALLGLRQYEPAADALSKAIERAPEAQQARLRDLRRECFVAESAIAASPPADRSIAPSAPNALPRSSPPAVVAPAASTRARLDPALWLDPSTGLMWARPWYYPPDASIGPWNFSDAQAFCAMLSVAEVSNWRLPTADELQHVFHVSSQRWYWSIPSFDPNYGIDDAMGKKRWRPPEFVVDGDHFPGTRMFLWTSTPADKPGSHVGLYFGERHSVSDEQRIGSTFEGSVIRTPFQGYALCISP